MRPPPKDIETTQFVVNERSLLLREVERPHTQLIQESLLCAVEIYFLQLFKRLHKDRKQSMVFVRNRYIPTEAFSCNEIRRDRVDANSANYKIITYDEIIC
jgi:hypothetical protein